MKVVARKRIFSSAFPPLPYPVNPTPSATPVLGSNDQPGESWVFPASEGDGEDAASEQIKWDRCWHTATDFLSLPTKPISAADADGGEDSLRAKWIKPYTSEVSSAIAYVVHPESRGRRTRERVHGSALLDWYLEEVLKHYETFAKPEVLKALRLEDSSDVLTKVVNVLQIAHVIYVHPLTSHILPLGWPTEGSYYLHRFLARLHGLVPFLLHTDRFVAHLNGFLRKKAFSVLSLNYDNVTHGHGARPDHGLKPKVSPKEECRDVLTTVRRLHRVGLGGAQAQRIFAEVMSDVMTAHVNCTYARQWSSPSMIIDRLRYWIENEYARLIVEVLACFQEDDISSKHIPLDVSLADVERWQEMAIHRLGALRTKELFDIIQDWDEGTRGAIEDLRHYVTTTAARTHLTSSFLKVLDERLLTPGAATVEILQFYIYVIRAFAILDPKGVLLDRIARPVRRYLRERDDTVKVIVTGLLADQTDETSASGVLSELAMELSRKDESTIEDDEDGELDWDDMSWMPDPVDAGPDYKKSKTSDIIGTLISLFDTKDVFVKEFQNLMGERLLRKDFEYYKESEVLEKLKLRFGEGVLQACEVMLQDMLNSERADNAIREEQSLHIDYYEEPAPDFHAKVLSHLYWPALHAESFGVPQEILDLQTRYEEGFEQLKASRKLTWLNALGQVTVHLDLEDREITEECQTWQATVIHAFQRPVPSVRTVSQLVRQIGMDEPLVRNALTFWVGKFVLQETSPDTYRVLEILSDASLDPDSSTAKAAVAAAAADAANAASAQLAVRSEEEVVREKMEVFRQYIVGMLTNQGPMPLPRIVMMLKFAVPGGFPFGNDELKEYMGSMVGEGKVELVGGNYKIVHGTRD